MAAMPANLTYAFCMERQVGVSFLFSPNPSSYLRDNNLDARPDTLVMKYRRMLIHWTNIPRLVWTRLGLDMVEHSYYILAASDSAHETEASVFV